MYKSVVITILIHTWR